MAKIKAVFQGIQEDVHAREIVEEVISLKSAKKVIICSAFAGQIGVEDISEALAKCDAPVEAYIGINNGSTSFEALMSLLQRDVSLYTVDTGIPGVIYHPKVYCSYTENWAKVFTGSSNLTFSGLNNNVEFGILLDLDLRDPDDRAVLNSVVSAIEAMRKINPDNVVRITTEEQLCDLYTKKQIETERTARQQNGAREEGKGEQTKKMSLSVRKPRFKKAIIIPPTQTTEEGEETSTVREKVPGKTGTIAETAQLHVWTKTKLSSSDAQVKRSDNTNPKGCITLSQSRFIGPDGTMIDQTKYFRDDVFRDLDWKTNPAKDREEAFANFELFIDGEYEGDRELMISHKASRVAGQGNTPTVLHVANFTSVLPKAKGKDLKMYKISRNQYKIDIK